MVSQWRTAPRLVFALFAVFVGLGTAHAQATVPCTTQLHLTLIKVHAAGLARPLTVVVDTGATISVIDAKLAKETRLQVVSTVDMNDAAGHDVTKTTVALPDWSVDGVGKKPPRVVFRGGVAAVSDLSSLSTMAGVQLDGILGDDLLHSLRLTIDWQTDTVAFGGDDPPSPDAWVIPLCSDPDDPNRKVRLEVNGHPVDATIDTGADTTCLSRQLLDKMPVGSVERRAKLGVGSTVLFGKAERAETVRVADFQIATVDERRPLRIPYYVVDSLGASSACVIGHELLSLYRFTLDYPRRLLILNPRQGGPKAGEPITTLSNRYVYGVGLLGDGKGAVSVMSVTCGTPAEWLGVKPNDDVATIDGRPASAYSTRMIATRVRRPGVHPKPLALELSTAGDATRRVVLPYAAEFPPIPAVMGQSK